MDEIQLVVDLHREGKHLGPGGAAQTKQALELAGLDRSRHLRIADLGCGTGASTLLLAQWLDATITAVDLFPAFLQTLRSRAAAQQCQGAIEPVVASLDALPFPDSTFDVLWSEGAIYNIGFENGLRAWHPLLRPGGVLVVSEITWTTAERPAEIGQHWEREYPAIATPSAKLAAVEQCGYRPTAFFLLPPHCWLENYYAPLEERFDRFLARHGSDAAAMDLIAAERREIDLYRRYSAFYSYGVYIAHRPE